MYKTTIKIKNTVPEEKANAINILADKLFNNRGGILKNISKDKYTLIFEGEDESAFACMGLGNLDLYAIKGVKECIESWTYIDTDEPPEEDVLEALSIPVNIPKRFKKVG
ncbi:MAG: hypothetical protein ACTTKD_08975 [Peptoanaerobacter stomatis]|uniref:hypothetical protein n=1 Tax=Peptoanaerobacter stomatis TaxID=796937 RepID=UPI003F9F129F